MKLINILKTFTVEFLITFLLFSTIYPTVVYLTDMKFREDNMVMGVVICVLIAITKVMTKKTEEKNEELIRSNYWKLKNELNRRVNGNQKRKRNSK
jgi:predicted PurR-regulated permease PerM